MAESRNAQHDPNSLLKNLVRWCGTGFQPVSAQVSNLRHTLFNRQGVAYRATGCQAIRSRSPRRVASDIAARVLWLASATACTMDARVCAEPLGLPAPNAMD